MGWTLPVERGFWIVDFPPGTSLEGAALYEAPFAYLQEKVRPVRAKARSGDATGVAWWIHQRPRPDMRHRISRLNRFIATTTVSKHRLFVWMQSPTLPDHQLIVTARADDCFFGVLQSRVHEVWALRMGTQLETRPRYTPTSCFETFPLPECVWRWAALTLTLSRRERGPRPRPLPPRRRNWTSCAIAG